jgi:hypothetical protein
MDVMLRAFQLVNPRRVPQEQARRGLVSQEAADRVSWKGPIEAYLTAEEIRREGLSTGLIADAILAMTGTDAKIVPCLIRGTPWVSYWPPRRGYMILADGFKVREALLTQRKSPY